MRSFIARSVCGSLLLILALCPDASAQTDEEVLVQLLEEVNGAINHIVNATTLFTSQDGVSSGYFKFKSDDPASPDTELEVLRIPLRHSFERDRSVPLRPYLRGNLAKLKFTEEVTPFDGSMEQNDFTTTSNYTVGVGGGVEFEPVTGLVITPDFAVSYARIENDYDFNNSISQLLQPLFDGTILNWDIDVLIYSPSLRLAYTLPLFEAVKITPTTSYAFIYNDSVHSSSDVIDIESDTGIFQSGIDARIPLGIALLNSGMAVRPFGMRTDVHGSARRALGFNHFYEVGMDLAFDTSQTVGVISEISVGSSYTFTEDLEGWRVGFGWLF